MSTAAPVDIDLDQGADFGVQIYWSNADIQPYRVMSPMRMEIRNTTGQVIYTLQTDDNAPDDAVKNILYNSDSGLIQLMIPAADTSTFPVGALDYDLFVTYQDNDVTNTTRLKRLIKGKVNVDRRYTQNV